MIYKFTKIGEKVIELASSLAIVLGHNYIGSEHILYGLSKQTNGACYQALINQGVYPDVVFKKIESILGKTTIILGGGTWFTVGAKKVFENAYNEAKQMNLEYISTEHLLVRNFERRRTCSKNFN